MGWGRICLPRDVPSNGARRQALALTLLGPLQLPVRARSGRCAARLRLSITGRDRRISGCNDVAVALHGPCVLPAWIPHPAAPQRTSPRSAAATDVQSRHLLLLLQGVRGAASHPRGLRSSKHRSRKKTLEHLQEHGPPLRAADACFCALLSFLSLSTASPGACWHCLVEQ